MKANFGRRLLAFLTDLLIVTSIFTLLNSIIPKNHNIQVLNGELTELRSEYLRDNIDTSIYLNRYATIQKSLDKENIPSNILNLIILLGYFALVPYYWDGKTIGKKIVKVRIVKDNLKDKMSLNDYLVRSLTIDGVVCFLVSMCTVFIIDDFRYFIITIICAIIQFLLVIISGFMVIYRHDKKGVHDLISGTQVVIEGQC